MNTVYTAKGDGKMNCKDCKNSRNLYYTDDKKEIQEYKQIQVNKKTRLFCKISKELAIQAPEKLLEYVKGINPFDVSYEVWNEGFLRNPRTKEEEEQAELYCVVNPIEPTEVSEVDETEDCGDFEMSKKEEFKNATGN